MVSRRFSRSSRISAGASPRSPPPSTDRILKSWPATGEVLCHVDAKLTLTLELASMALGVDSSHEHYKWWALSCTSLGILLATINSGTLIIALPDLERSLGTSLLQLVWVILAYMIASTVLVLTAGRLSDLFGRKKAY